MKHYVNLGWVDIVELSPIEAMQQLGRARAVLRALDKAILYREQVERPDHGLIGESLILDHVEDQLDLVDGYLDRLFMAFKAAQDKPPSTLPTDSSVTKKGGDSGE